MRENILIFIPTYNERENIQELCERIISLDLESDILFIDDNSPDGTGKLINRLARKYPNIYVIHRSEKLGIGSAHLEGIKWAYDREYTVLITMDCDFAHAPEYIPDIIDNSQDADIVIGSRYILKDSLEGWNLLRRILTLTGHFMTKYFLKMRYDATGAFRLYRLDKIPEHVFKIITSIGYSFFFESLFILNLNQFSIKEIPIKLPPRTYGHSKMNFKDARRSLIFLLTIYLTTLFNRKKFKICKPSNSKTNLKPPIRDNRRWDAYWKSKKNIIGFIYDAIAVFYRKFIIKRSLNHFIKKYFKKGSMVLHAGCGSGQVDVDIRNYLSINAMDISEEALALYKRVNRNHCKLINGNLFDIPLLESSMDGIYNLGVMEHFIELEIQKILNEFYRVLKPKGKIVFFWPNKNGLSVNLFKFFYFILNKVFKKNIKLYPDEHTLAKSNAQIETILKKANLNIIEHYFGIRDLFTHSIIVVNKR